jgi:hypothetical protein
MLIVEIPILLAVVGFAIALRYYPVAVVVVLIYATGKIQGAWTERWGEFPELALYAEQLKNVPKEIGGDWNGEDTQSTDANKRILEIAGAVGSLSRVYRNDRNEQVSVFVVCGRLEDVFFHTPERCYPAAGFESNGEVSNQRIEFGSDVADFKTATFLKSDPGGNQNLRIYWSFNADGKWVAPEEHRWSFAGQRAMYKVYVSAPVTSRDQNPALEFIQVLIPELNKALEPAFTAGDQISNAAGNSAGGAPAPAAEDNKS